MTRRKVAVDGCAACADVVHGSPPAGGLAAITDRLLSELHPLRFGAPVTHVYNPLLYARAPYRCGTSPP